METYKVGIPNWTSVRYKGEKIMIQCGPYWTTTKANNETQAKINAIQNLLVKIAQKEMFTWGNIKE